jgi:hypothetical protein
MMRKTTLETTLIQNAMPFFRVISLLIAQVFGVRKQGIKGIFKFLPFRSSHSFISGYRQFLGGVFPFDSSTIDNSDDDEDDTEVLFICLCLYVCVEVCE